jgi:hypothetical protein
MLRIRAEAPESEMKKQLYVVWYKALLFSSKFP